MKIIQVNKDLKINVELLYSLERKDNQYEIDEWDSAYQKQMDEFSKNPPLLPIDVDELFQPKFDGTDDNDKLINWGEALNAYIVSIIGDKPIYKEKFIVILATGLKVNINKAIYEQINNYLEKYIDKEI